MPAQLIALLTEELNLSTKQNVLQIERPLLNLADLAKLPVSVSFTAPTPRMLPTSQGIHVRSEPLPTSFLCCAFLSQGVDAKQVDKRKLEGGLCWPGWKAWEHPQLVVPPQQKKRLRKRRRWAGNRWKGMRSIFSAVAREDVLVQVTQVSEHAGAVLARSVGLELCFLTNFAACPGRPAPSSILG